MEMLAFKMMVRGEKNNCYIFFGSVPCLGDKFIISEMGDEENFMLVFEGYCEGAMATLGKPWNDEFMVEIPNDSDEAQAVGELFWDYSIQKKTELFDVEVWCNSINIDAGDLEFVHWVKGASEVCSCPKELEFAPFGMNEDYDEFETLGMDEEAVVGEVVLFGRYSQSSETSEEPIEWLVLEDDGSTQLLISKYVLDCYEFSGEAFDKYLSGEKKYFWGDCESRNWLNNEFYNKAFNEAEKEKIMVSEIANMPNFEYGTGGEDNSFDKVFLLSIEEANQYFEDETSRRTSATEYAELRGVYNYSETGMARWFLRTAGGNEGSVAFVAGYYLEDWDEVDPLSGGEVEVYGDYVDSYGVRPVIRIKKERN